MANDFLIERGKIMANRVEIKLTDEQAKELLKFYQRKVIEITDKRLNYIAIIHALRNQQK